MCMRTDTVSNTIIPCPTLLAEGYSVKPDPGEHGAWLLCRYQVMYVNGIYVSCKCM